MVSGWKPGGNFYIRRKPIDGRWVGSGGKGTEGHKVKK